MPTTKQPFVKFLLNHGVLKFGEFRLKSGRLSPFFFNLAKIDNGAAMNDLADYYADAIVENFDIKDGDVLFGPAYKGISLACATAMALADRHGITVRFCSDRKEIKDHGDQGWSVGSKLNPGDRILMIEDVTTSGASMEQTIPLIKANVTPVEILGLIVSVNRCEKGQEGNQTALEEISERYGIKTAAITSMATIVDQLRGTTVLPDEMLQAITEYYEQYGVDGKLTN